MVFLLEIALLVSLQLVLRAYPHAAVHLSVHGHTLTALINSYSSDSFMSENIAKMLNLQIKPSTRNISMTLSTMNTKILGYCEIDPKINGHDYKNVRLSSLFTYILPTCRHIATRSRHFSINDKAFIQSEIVKLLQTRVIEPSSSPWRAQVVVVKNPSQPGKKRLCVDYSQTKKSIHRTRCLPSAMNR